jgi:hypothetical protein
MKYEIQERICDECGKKEQMKMVTQFGSTPFRGWIRAHIEGGDGLSSSFDFCSSDCAGKHFTLFREVSNEKDQRRKNGEE